MPLHIADVNPTSFQDVKEKFIIFYSSVVDGKLWCPDCVAVDDLVKHTFGPADAPSALIVHVGDRAVWRDPSNPYRAEPWNIKSIPTIMRILNSEEDGRLVESDCSSIASFIDPVIESN